MPRAGELAERWASRPAWPKWVLVAYPIGFADGTGAHVRDLVRGGLHAYAFAPAAVQVFFVGLVLLDPLVFVLVLRMRPAGAWLAAAVMAADTATNWYVNWSAPPEYQRELRGARRGLMGAVPRTYRPGALRLAAYAAGEGVAGRQTPAGPLPPSVGGAGVTGIT